MNLRLLVCVGLTVGSVSCDLASATDRGRETVPVGVTVNSHNIAVGDTIPSVLLPCVDGQSRTVAPPSEVQLLTFSTPADCSACQPHLEGIGRLSGDTARLAVPHRFVVYATPAERLMATRMYGDMTTGAVCIDSAGVFWDQVNIAHTPVTVLLVDGVIEYLYDGPLTSDEQARAFTSDVAYFEQRASGASATSRPGR